MLACDCNVRLYIAVTVLVQQLQYSFPASMAQVIKKLMYNTSFMPYFIAVCVQNCKALSKGLYSSPKLSWFGKSEDIFNIYSEHFGFLILSVKKSLHYKLVQLDQQCMLVGFVSLEKFVQLYI